MKKLDNRGFTLTELIVVIAILGILAGALTASVGQIFSNKTRKFVNECDAMLTRCRVETLSGAPANTYVELRLETDGYYYATFNEGGDVKEEKRLENSNAVCKYTISGTETPLTSLRISFDRSTGAMASACAQITQIDISGHKINLVPATGYHSIGG